MASLTDVAKLQEFSEIIGKTDSASLERFVGSLGISGEERSSILDSLKSLPDMASTLSEVSPSLFRMGNWQ